MPLDVTRLSDSSVYAASTIGRGWASFEQSRFHPRTNLGTDKLPSIDFDPAWLAASQTATEHRQRLLI
jgi:hypothetical protein